MHVAKIQGRSSKLMKGGKVDCNENQPPIYMYLEVFEETNEQFWNINYFITFVEVSRDFMLDFPKFC